MAASGALADYQESRRCIAAASGTTDPEATAGTADMLESLLRLLRLDSGLWQSRNLNQSLDDHRITTGHSSASGE